MIATVMVTIRNYKLTNAHSDDMARIDRKREETMEENRATQIMAQGYA
jgi:hypothetical protein